MPQHTEQISKDGKFSVLDGLGPPGAQQEVSVDCAFHCQVRLC